MSGGRAPALSCSATCIQPCLYTQLLGGSSSNYLGYSLLTESDLACSGLVLLCLFVGDFFLYWFIVIVEIKPYCIGQTGLKLTILSRTSKL